VRYLRLNALGLAILFSFPGNTQLGKGLVYRDLAPAPPESGMTPGEVEVLHDERRFARRHVVLIDELDKAPRDTPNDLLQEIEQMGFWIRELDVNVKGSVSLRPAVVITSNSEKSLPEPFLRRCVFHHIRSPDDTRRREIVRLRRHPFAQRTLLYEQAMHFFNRLHGALGRSPGTAELLAWLTILEDHVTRVSATDGGQPPSSLKGLLRSTLVTIAKTREDLDRAEQVLALPGAGRGDQRQPVPRSPPDPSPIAGGDRGPGFGL
jgi:MoxR-like ATPase